MAEAVMLQRVRVAHKLAQSARLHHAGGDAFAWKYEPAIDTVERVEEVFEVTEASVQVGPESVTPSLGVDCRPANGSLSTGNIRRIFDGIFESPCVQWYTSVDSRRLSTVELKSKAFLAVDSGARHYCQHRASTRAAAAHDIGRPYGLL